tara:strand:- start:1853 stop:3004 length:1152 start_codon:yes stop_codon:yes gene_type:complete
VALVPFALDAYLPAFPDIARDLGVPINEVGLTLSVYVFVLAAGQLVGGPLSDRFGRRPVVFAGLAVFIIGSLMVTTATSLPAMMGWRALQAFGGGWVAVSVPAIVRDQTSGRETARLFSLISLIMFIAPAIAPTVGTALMAVLGWHGIFEFLALYAMLVAVLLQTLLFPRAPVGTGRREPLAALVTNYRHVLGHGTVMMLVALQAVAFSVLLIYLTHAPFLLQNWLGLDNRAFSMVFAVNVAAMAGVSLLNRRLLHRLEPYQILRVSVPLQLTAVLALLAIIVTDAPRWLVIPGLMALIGTMGAIAPNVQASVMQFFRELGGTAAAVLGAVQFAGGGVLSALSALIVQGHAERVALAMLACACAASLLVWPVAARLRQAGPVA